MLDIGKFIVYWFFLAYTLYRIGKKLNIDKSYAWYLIPIWNLWILARKSDMKIVTFFLPISLLIMLEVLAVPQRALILLLKLILSSIFIFKFWGSVAHKLGKEYKSYGVLAILIPILPPLMLAFDNIDKLFASTSLYSLSEEEKQILKSIEKPMSEVDKRAYTIVRFLGWLLILIVPSYFYM